MPEMGLIYVHVKVSNPTQPERSWEGTFLVDTGATDCYVPAPILNAIGIQPAATRTYELADGVPVKMDIGVARFEIMGEVVGATVIFGKENAAPLLGVTALESAGIEVDPKNQQLKKLPSVPLKELSFSMP